MHNLIYTKYSIDREDRFKIRTDILMDEAGNKIVRKKAYTSESQGHIERICEVYNQLNSFYSEGDIRINECVFDGTCVQFPFIEGETLEQILDNFLEKNETNKAVDCIKDYCDRIRRNAHKGFDRTEDFVSVFGDVDFGQDTSCVNVADVDLLFPNIIVNDSWNIIDYEWTFLFDVPVDFIIYRAISNYVNGMFGGSSREELKNMNILELVGIEPALVDVYKEMDANFSSYVIGKALTGRELQQLVGKPVVDVKRLAQDYSVDMSIRIVQVYYDYGQGFSEENCEFIMPSWEMDNSIDLKIVIPNSCVAVRIDPMMDCGFLFVDSITMDGKDVDYDRNGTKVEGIIAFYDNDPHIVVKDVIEGGELCLKGKVCLTDDYVAQNIKLFGDRNEEKFNLLGKDIQSLNEQRDELGKNLQTVIEQRDFLDNHCQTLNQRIDDMGDIITEKNSHIDNLQVQLYSVNQERDLLVSKCNQLEAELNQNIFIRLLKKNKVTLKIGKGIKFYLRNGFKPTCKVIRDKFRNRFSKKFYKDKIVLKEATVETGNNVIAINSINQCEKMGGTIAVHLHLFYFDLLPEFIWYLNNIPYKFDLFISCQVDGPVKKITKMTKKIKNVGRVVVKECQNRGRDIAPLYVWFRDEIEKYDYFLHMHSKKSLYTGTEKVGWRQMSLDSLLGSGEVVSKIFGMFEDNDRVGLIYPEYYMDFCKFHCSWLTNDIIGREFLDKLNIEQDKMMFCYPAGSFFWARTEAIKPLFDIKLTIEDFPEEQGQTDTTLAHVLERAIACVAEDRGYYGALIDLDEGVVRTRYSLKLFRDYTHYNAESALEVIKKFDAVSFDIFGTLVMNKAYSRSLFFEYIQNNYDEVLPEYDFVANRKLAEKKAIEKYGDNTKLDNIYQYLGDHLGISDALASKLMDCEIKALVELCVTRQDVHNMYQALVRREKKIVLVEDTYYSSETLKQILESCGYNTYDDLWISSERGKRKDKDELWDDFYNEYADVSIVHVGDNPRADWQTVYDRGKNAFWVMNGFDEFCMSAHYQEYENEMKSYEGAMKVAEIVNEKFNSPFAL